MQGYVLERGIYYAENISAEKASQKERTWLQKENGGQKRQKGFGKKKSKGQKKTDLLMMKDGN